MRKTIPKTHYMTMKSFAVQTQAREHRGSCTRYLVIASLRALCLDSFASKALKYKQEHFLMSMTLRNGGKKSFIYV